MSSGTPSSEVPGYSEGARDRVRRGGRDHLRLEHVWLEQLVVTEPEQAPQAVDAGVLWFYLTPDEPGEPRRRGADRGGDLVLGSMASQPADQGVGYPCHIGTVPCRHEQGKI